MSAYHSHPTHLMAWLLQHILHGAALKLLEASTGLECSAAGSDGHASIYSHGFVSWIGCQFASKCDSRCWLSHIKPYMSLGHCCLKDHLSSVFLPGWYKLREMVDSRLLQLNRARAFFYYDQESMTSLPQCLTSGMKFPWIFCVGPTLMVFWKALRTWPLSQTLD